MAARTVSLVLLFVVAFLISGAAIVAAGFLSDLARPSGMVLIYALTFITFVAVFFVGRGAILPAGIARRPLHAGSILAVWIAATMMLALGVNWTIDSALEGFGVRIGVVTILPICMIASVPLLDRVARVNQGNAMR